jgi:rubredoxin
MGYIKEYLCSVCKFEQTYFLGIGFSNQKEVKMFECNNCKAINKSVMPNPNCSKCNKKSLSEILDFNKKLKCPKCAEIKFQFEIEGMWD